MNCSILLLAQPEVLFTHIAIVLFLYPPFLGSTPHVSWLFSIQYYCYYYHKSAHKISYVTILFPLYYSLTISEWNILLKSTPNVFLHHQFLQITLFFTPLFLNYFCQVKQFMDSNLENFVYFGHLYKTVSICIAS